MIVEQLEDLYLKQFLSRAAIAKKLGTTQWAITTSLRDAGVPLRGKGRIQGRSGNVDRDRAICELANGGVSQVDIGKQYGISRQRVAQIVGTPEKGLAYCDYCGEQFLRKSKVHRYCTPRCGKKDTAKIHSEANRKRRLAEIIACIAAPDANGCHLWIGAKNPISGYGLVCWNGKYDSAHRWVWRQFVGEIPPELHVLHTCGISACVNPDHLILGTMADNVRNRDNNGRYKTSRRFSADQVRSIRQAYTGANSLPQLTQEFGVSALSIYNIATRKTYAKVAD